MRSLVVVPAPVVVVEASRAVSWVYSATMLSKVDHLTTSYNPAPAREAPVTPDCRDAS